MLFLGKKESMGRGATELENLNGEGGELTFCYVGVFERKRLEV